MPKSILILFLLFSNIVFGQKTNPTVLIYFDSEKEDIFYEFKMIDIINDLTDVNKNELIFSQVGVLNEITQNTIDRKELRQIVNNIEEKKVEKNKRWEREKKDVIKFLLNHDFFLKIEVVQNEKAIEYKFRLYETLDDNNDNSLPQINVLSKKIKRTATIIETDRLTDESYMTLKLTHQIKQLFPNCNFPPFAVISINDTICNHQDTFQLGLGDSLVFSAKNSLDKDAHYEEFSYEWQEVLESTAMIPTLNVDKKSLEKSIQFNKKGYYKIGLILSDGITSSTEKTVTIQVVNKPTINIDNKNFRIRHQGNFYPTFKRSTLRTNINYHNKRETDELRFFFYTDTSKNNLTSLSKNKIAIRQSRDIITQNDELIFNTKLYKGTYHVNLQTQNKQQPFLKSNIEEVTLLNRTYPPYWVNFYLEALSFYAISNNEKRFVWCEGILINFSSFVDNNIGFELGIQDFTKHQISDTIYEIDEYRPVNHFALIYKPSTDFYIKSFKLESTFGLVYRRMPYEVDFQNQMLISHDKLGLQLEIGILPSFKYPFSFNMKMIFFTPNYELEGNLMERHNSVISVGVGYAFDLLPDKRSGQ
ncbi:MAG: hypothetical protein AB8G11_24800 [Saprospiraceae bacterium]